MAYCFQKSLQELVLLPHRALHSRTRHWRGQLGSAEFKLGLCLLAWQQNGGLGKMGYRSLNEYAEKALQLSGKKLYALLSTVRALQYLPKLCEAYQNGTLCWSCLRSIQTLATPETQDVWLAFAREYRSDQIARMVAMSPRKWKWYRALEASLQQRPLITAEELATMLRELAPLARAGGRRKKLAPDSALSSAPAEAAEAGSSSGNESASGMTAAIQAGGEGRPVSAQQSATDGLSREIPCNTRRDVPLGLELFGAKTDDSTSDSASLATPFCLSSGPAVAQRLLSDIADGSLQTPASLGISDLMDDWSAGRPKIVRLTVEMTCDEYATYESGVQIIRARVGKRMSQGAVLARMAEEVLNSAPSRVRAKHQILIYTTPESDDAWYETSKGLLPASPEILAQARANGLSPIAVAQEHNLPSALSHLELCRRSNIPSSDSIRAPLAPEGGVHLPSEGTATEEMRETEADLNVCVGQATIGASLEKRHGRQQIPVAVLRALRARSGGKCERCGCGGYLQIHHKTPVSEGGGNHLDNLEHVCSGCHAGGHERDYEEKPHWRKTRDAAIARSAGNVSGGSSQTREVASEGKGTTYDLSGTSHTPQVFEVATVG